MEEQIKKMIGKNLAEVMDSIPNLRSQKLDELLDNVNPKQGYTFDEDIMHETFSLLNS
jgi:hypothetical protein